MGCTNSRIDFEESSRSPIPQTKKSTQSAQFKVNTPPVTNESYNTVDEHASTNTRVVSEESSRSPKPQTKKSTQSAQFKVNTPPVTDESYNTVDEYASTNTRDVSEESSRSPKPQTKTSTQNTNLKVNTPLVINESYAVVDEHARKAPPHLRNSKQDLVAYLSKPSTEPKLVVRAIFVWISENIAYDADGYFGRKQRAPCDATAVMKGGKSVCEGYANVMESLCREADIPVKKVSGYVKGIGSSAENPATTSRDTDHAWNAVQLAGKWFLIDSTWGSGHLDIDKAYNFKKCFKEFYFLTDPRQFIFSHFPYMEGDMEASMKWQLLDKPISLEEFNRNVETKPHAFELGVKPVSHMECLITVKDNVVLSFSSTGKEGISYSAHLMYEEGNMLHEKPRNIFSQIENGLFNVRIHPHKIGLFRLNIYGRRSNKEDTFSELFEYTLQCEKAEKNLEFPETYVQAQVDRCILYKPLQYKLKRYSAVEFHIVSPFLNRVMVNETLLEKNGTSFTGSFKTRSERGSLSVWGSRKAEGRLNGIYEYQIV